MQYLNEYSSDEDACSIYIHVLVMIDACVLFDCVLGAIYEAHSLISSYFAFLVVEASY